MSTKYGFEPYYFLTTEFVGTKRRRLQGYLQVRLVSVLRILIISILILDCCVLFLYLYSFCVYSYYVFCRRIWNSC